MKIRRKTRQIKIGNVRIGGEAPVSIQSMAKTNTSDTQATINEIENLRKIGCEVVRLAVKNEKDIPSLGMIKKGTRIPLVADIHFNYKLALLALEEGVDAIRLNPGNIKKAGHIKEILRFAKKKRIPIRIGVNSGSLKTPSLMVKNVIRYLKMFEEQNFRDIIISLKSSNVSETIEANRYIAGLCNYPIHLGVTASGLPQEGMLKSAIGIGTLLLDGIGDTIRVSLTGEACEEVIAAKSILQSLGLRRFGPDIISCPTCGRCQVDLVRIVGDLQNKLTASAKGGPASGGNHKPQTANRPLTIAVMGCEVNGPGEARNADIGIAAGKRSGVLFKKGKIVKKIKEGDFVTEIMKEAKLKA